MAQTISVDAKTIQIIFTRLEALGKDVAELKEKLFEKEPSYGSDAWWDKEIQNADKDFKAGKGTRFSSVKDATKWLDS